MGHSGRGGENRRRNQAAWALLPVLFLVVLFATAGCLSTLSGAGGKNKGQRSMGPDHGALISVFLQLQESEGPHISLALESLEVLAGDSWLPMPIQPQRLDSAAIGAGQIFVAHISLVPGQYEQFRLRVADPALERDGGQVFLMLAEPLLPLTLPDPLRLEKGDSRALFIHWDVRGSMTNEALLAPNFQIVQQPLPLVADLAVVACPDINTLYLLRTDRNRVSGALGVPGRPTYLAVDRSRGRLYVLASDEAMIHVYELATLRMVDSFKIPLTRSPGYMAMSSDGGWAFVLDGRGNYLLRMDLDSGTLAGRVRLGDRPQYLLYMPEENRLAVSFAYTQSVLILDADTLATVETVPVGRSPQGLLVRDGILYIAETASGTLTIYNLEDRQLQRRLNVGGAPRRLVASDDRIYLANSGGDSLSMLLPGQHLVSRQIPLPGNPLEMATASGRRWLYVGEGRQNGLAVIDLTSNRLSAHIDLGASPLGLVVVQ